MTVKKRIIIKGKKVHNVGYRPFLMEKAQELKILNFHAKNVKEDGWQVVDVRVGGEEGRIDSFLKFARKNSPEPAEVDNISWRSIPAYSLPCNSQKSLRQGWG
jgi:acylphosphatase